MLRIGGSFITSQEPTAEAATGAAGKKKNVKKRSYARHAKYMAQHTTRRPGPAPLEGDSQLPVFGRQMRRRRREACRFSQRTRFCSMQALFFQSLHAVCARVLTPSACQGCGSLTLGTHAHAGVVHPVGPLAIRSTVPDVLATGAHELSVLSAHNACVVLALRTLRRLCRL